MVLAAEPYERTSFDVYDVVVRQRPQGPLLARAYRPRRTGLLPAVVEVHGGGWISGDRCQNKAIAEALAAAGILVFSLDFRMPPEEAYPASIADVNLGTRWLKAHSAEFSTSPNLVGGLGTSSGGHQILLSGLRPKDKRYAALPLPDEADARLRYIVVCWPVSDPLARYRLAQTRHDVRRLDALKAYWPSEDSMVDGNPQLIVETRETIDLPPVLIIQGTADENLTPDMADRFAAAYRDAGGVADLQKFEGEPHTFINNAPTSPSSQAALETMVKFIHRMSESPRNG